MASLQTNRHLLRLDAAGPFITKKGITSAHRKYVAARRYKKIVFVSSEMTRSVTILHVMLIYSDKVATEKEIGKTSNIN